MSNQHKKTDASLLHVATLGRTVGLHGDIKLHIESDFPEQFVAGATFLREKGDPLRIASVNPQRETVRIEGYESVEMAKRLTNVKLFTTPDATRDACELDEDEYFWFDVIGCKVYDQGQELGIVTEIERIGIQDYLSIKTAGALVAQGLSKNFLIPYQDPFVLGTDIDAKRIDVQGGLDILEAS